MEGCRDIRGGGGPPPLLPTSSSSRRHRSRPRQHGVGSGGPWWRVWMKKYVIACLVCGGLSVSHGVVFIVIYLLLRSYTTSLQFFETIPTYVPGVVFIITGLILMCFAKRRNRYTFLLKMGGGCCVVSALLCVVMTVTTTVVHMNRLQTLHECVYTPLARTCMCVSAIGDHASEGAHRYVFQHTPNCEVVHGALYSCLRALFSFSVLGILLCIACSMLTYQLLSHEKKRLYWEQLEVRRRFLYQRHSHHSVCGCYDELYPWQLWEMLDYRFLHNNNNSMAVGSIDDECPPPAHTPPSNSSNNNRTRRNNGHRPSGWNWLPWPRHQADRGSQPPPENDGDQTTLRQNLMNRLMSRDTWNQPTSVPEENCGGEMSDSVGSLPWRSECIHIFRPSPRDRHCFPPMRFGMRSSRNSPYGRPHHHHHPNHHRRTRSNDGIFHHLHMNSAAAPPRYAQPYSMVDASGGMTCHFAEMPRYMWGPPPPYSQPPSVENLALYEEAQMQSRRTGMSGLEQLGGALEMSRCNRVLSALEMVEQPGNGSMSSKMSTPLSERRFVCHNFSSDGITLTIGGNYNDLCSQDSVPQEHKKEDTCIVEVHVPYILHKKDIMFNTLPARSCRRKDSNPFKSLSNIPLGLSRKINALKTEKSDPGQLSVIKACCDLEEEDDVGRRRELDSITPVRNVESYMNHSRGLKSLSSQLFCDGPPSLNNLETDTLSYHTTVEVPSEFKSSLVISTHPSTPGMENFANKVHAQSMPNLNLSNSSSLPRHIRRAPSSGNTSTSQDFADFDLEEDSSPFVLCSPVSDIPSLPPLPDDDASDSSSSYPPCPRLFRCDHHEMPFSNSGELTPDNSDSSSCGVIVIGGTDKRHSNETSVPSIILSKRPPTDCPINCAIRHLHHYHPDKIEVRDDNLPREHAFNMSRDRATSNFVVTIKSVNV